MDSVDFVRGVSESFDRQLDVMYETMRSRDLAGSDSVCASLAVHVGSQAGEHFFRSGRSVRHTIKFPMMMENAFEHGDFEAARAWAVAWPKAAYYFLHSVGDCALVRVKFKDDVNGVKSLLDDAALFIESMTRQMKELEEKLELALADESSCRMAM